MNDCQRIWRGSAAQFHAKFHFVLSEAQREVLARAEGLGEPLIAVIADYPFGRYLLDLDVDEEQQPSAVDVRSTKE